MVRSQNQCDMSDPAVVALTVQPVPAGPLLTSPGDDEEIHTTGGDRSVALLWDEV